MLRVQFKKINSEFEYPFQTSHGIKTHQPALLVALTLNGMTGVGEAPAIHYYHVTVEEMVEQLISKSAMIEKYAFTEPARFWHFCHHLFPNNHFLVCALDMAYWDLYSKLKRGNIRQFLGLPEDMKVEKEPMTDYTLGMDSVEEMIQKMKAHPWPIYKIKCGGLDDLKTIQALRNETDAVFRVDANGGWSLEEALHIIPELKKLGVELVEQPLNHLHHEEMKELFLKSPLPLFADESCVTENDVAECIPYFHGINIKLTKCGGITPAVRMILQAKKAGKKIMMGCMSETEPGSYAIAQFIPWLDVLDMDGPLLLKNIELKKMKYERGRVYLSAHFPTN